MALIIIDNEGTKHLRSPSLSMYSTACGDCDILENTYTEDEGVPNCRHCLNVAEMVFESITKSELKKALKSNSIL